jgi:hypothetical protein
MPSHNKALSELRRCLELSRGPGAQPSLPRSRCHHQIEMRPKVGGAGLRLSCLPTYTCDCRGWGGGGL